MTTKPNSPAQGQPVTPEVLVNQLFDAAVMAGGGDPTEHVIGFLTNSLFYALTSAKRDLIVFLTEALLYISAMSAPDEASRKELLKKISETLLNAPPLQPPNAQGQAPAKP
jgi:hypothetical protein